MSADNGIYILPIKFNGVQRFFVREASAIDNLCHKPSHGRYSLKEVIGFLLDSRGYASAAGAISAAHSHFSRNTEYGVVVLEPLVINT